MTTCPHLNELDYSKARSGLLDPLHWKCSACCTTESCWMCLVCANVGCGRDISGHSKDHFTETNHSIVMDIKTTYTHCYRCDEYVMNDNPKGELFILRELVEGLKSQTIPASKTRSGRVIRNASHLNSHNGNPLSPPALVRSFSSAKIKPLVQPEDQVDKNTGRCGLVNLGNTCYMNSVLQVLCHSDTLREFLFRHKIDVNSIHGTEKESNIHSSPTEAPASPSLASSRKPRSRVTKKTSLVIPTEIHKQLLTFELRGVFHAMWYGKTSSFAPESFLAAIWALIPAFRGYSQQDAQEFLHYVLDRLQSEGVETVFPLQKIDLSPEDKNAGYIMRQIFCGKLCSVVTCSSCKNNSSKEETFFDLSVPMPEEFSSANKRKRPNIGECSLADCLKLFTETEELSGSNKYYCEKCSGYQDASKKIILSSLPKNFCLHIKRFGGYGVRRSKIDTWIKFPLRGLDFKLFSSAKMNTIYDCYGVVCHSGSGLGSGHYTSYVYNHPTNEWLFFNDKTVKNVTEEQVVTAQAYILFYRRRPTYSATSVSNILDILKQEELETIRRGFQAVE